MARLENICSINMGQSPESSSYNENGEGMPFFQGNADFGELHPKVRIWCNAPAKIAECGDILISVRAPIGALNIADKQCCIGRGLAALTVNETLCSPKYLWYGLECKVDELNSKGTGSTFKAINKKTLAETEIPLPPLEEQRRIAALLDKVSDLIAKRRAQLDKLDLLVKARFVEMFGDPVSNPNGYLKIKVGEAVASGYIEKPLDGNHGEKHPKTAEYVDDGIPFIMANNLTDSGEVDLIHCAHITRERAIRLDKGFAHNLDVLITHKGTIGRTAILYTDLDFVMLTPQVTYYRIKKGMTPDYLKAYFSTDYFQMEMANLAAGGSTRAYVGITAQLSLPILIPPLPLQKDFSNYVEQANKSKLTIQQSLDKLEILKKALMQQYFG